MDKRRARILKYLLSLCEEGKYVIIKVLDVLNELHLPDNAEARGGVVSAVKYFVDNEYIGCKYYDSDNICCVSMAKGRAWTDESNRAEKKRYNQFWLAGICFLCAFVGSFLGALLAGLI